VSSQQGEGDGPESSLDILSHLTSTTILRDECLSSPQSMEEEPMLREAKVLAQNYTVKQ
jgi:hypothetical protein